MVREGMTGMLTADMAEEEVTVGVEALEVVEGGSEEASVAEEAMEVGGKMLIVAYTLAISNDTQSAYTSYWLQLGRPSFAGRRTLI